MHKSEMTENRIKMRGRVRNFQLISIYLGFLLLIVNLGIFFIDYRAGLLVLFFTVFYFAVTLVMYFYNKPIIIREFVDFATEYGQIQKTILRELDLPYALIDETGKIFWHNASFEEAAGSRSIRGKSLQSFFPALTLDLLPNGTSSSQTQTDIISDSHDYQVRFKYITLDSLVRDSMMIEPDSDIGHLIAVFLYDETALHIALQEVDDQSLCLGLLYLDNYDEALESVDEVRRSLLTALTDRRINQYLASVDGLARKLEKDKYLLILRKRSVEQLRNGRFSILEDVKQVSIGNNISMTLSIGLGVDGLSYAQNYEFARTAIDLALGRGGDQAVIKTPKDIFYYGGKSQETEKTTRVKARIKAHALEEIIETKEQILVMGHRDADVDSFGAAVGICRVAMTLQHSTHVVLQDISTSLSPIVEMFRNNPNYPEDFILTNQQALERADENTALVIVDVNKPSITECPGLIKVCSSIVVLDHHRAGEEVVENATLSYVEPYASSTSEMVSEILQYISVVPKIRSEEADAMYAGILIDTDNFNSKAGVRTFEAAAFLRRCGADITRIRKMFREDPAEYRAKAAAISAAEMYRNIYAVSECPSDGIQNPNIVAAQAANDLLSIRGIKASFVLTTYQGKIYISARSIDEVNVQLIMERMGGGGHINAAGTQLVDMTPEEAVRKLKDTIDTMTEERAI